MLFMCFILLFVVAVLEILVRWEFGAVCAAQVVEEEKKRDVCSVDRVGRMLWCVVSFTQLAGRLDHLLGFGCTSHA